MAHGHPGPEIREAIGQARPPHRQPAVRVEAEEVDPRPSVHGDVGANVYLQESGREWQRRQAAQPKPLHPEGGHRQPGTSLTAVRAQLRGHHAPEHLGVNRPMREEELPPGLGHEPAPLRKWPWTMIGLRKYPSLALRDRTNRP